MPSMTNGENKEFTQPDFNGEGGEFVPRFENWGNGEFAPPEGREPGNNEGDRFNGGMMGGFGRNAKTCLIINGGYLELCGNDDCIDANGTMEITGGVVKATNPTGAFTGNFGVLDADGQVIIGENANVVLASSSGSEKSLNLSQNSIIIYCEAQHSAKDQISISDSKGNVVYEYAPEGNFKTVLIASNDIKIGHKYSIKIGNENFETEITGQITTIGTPGNGGMGFGRGPMK